MALTREKLIRIIERRVRSRELAEQVVDDIDIAYLAADEGVGVPPPPEREEAPQPPTATAPPPSPAVTAARPPKPAERMLVLPGDREFHETTVSERGKVSKPVPVGRISSPGRARKKTETKWWDAETIIPELSRAFPPEMDILPPGRERPIRVVRDIRQVVPGDIVRVQYAHKAASEDLGSIGTMESPDVVKLPAVAVHTFTFYERELDIDAAMDDLLTQLNGMYRPKAQQLMPQMGMEGPLRLEDAAATDVDATRAMSGWKPVGSMETVQLRDGTVMQVARAQGVVIGDLTRQHQQEAPEAFKAALGRK